LTNVSMRPLTIVSVRPFSYRPAIARRR
jgi:hypothetical protein